MTEVNQNAPQRPKKSREKWTKEAIYKAFVCYLRKEHRFPTIEELCPENDLPSYSTCKIKLGVGEIGALQKAIIDFLAATGEEIQWERVTPNSANKQFSWSKKSLLEGLIQFAQEHDRFPITSEGELQKVADDFLESTNKKLKGRCTWSAKSVLASLISFAKDSNRFPVTADLETNDTLPNPQTVARHLGADWYGVLSKELRRQDIAVFSSTHWTRETICWAFEAFIKKEHRFPTAREIYAYNNLPSRTVCQKILGTIRVPELKRIVTEYLGTQEDEPSWNKPDNFDELSVPGTWDTQSIIAGLVNFVKKYHKYPTRPNLQTKYQLPSYDTIHRHLGANWIERLNTELERQNIPLPSAPLPEVHPESTKPSSTACPPIAKPSKPEPSPKIASYVGKGWNWVYSPPEDSGYIWNKEKVLASLVKFVREYNKLPTNRDLRSTSWVPNDITVCRYLGSDWRQQLTKELTRQDIYGYKKAKNVWTADTILESLVDFVLEYDKFPVDFDLVSTEGVPSPTTVNRYLGANWREVLEEELRRQNILDYERTQVVWTKASIYAAHEKFVERTQRFPSAREYITKNGLPSYQMCKKELGDNWRPKIQHYLSEKGYEFSLEPKTKWNTQSTEKALLAFIAKHKRMPLDVELNPAHSLPTPYVCIKRLGKDWRQTIANKAGIRCSRGRHKK